MKTTISKAFSFDAAHFLPKVSEGHKCKNLHGHTYKVILKLKGEIDPEMGWIIDFSEISSYFKPILTELDHKLLNNIKGLENPTAENISGWIFIKLKGVLKELSSVTVYETESCWAETEE